jgi:predicted metal-dependent hydrolase
MSSKQIELAGIGPISVHKRRGSRNIRLTVTSDGRVRVTIPAWASFASGVAFARDRTAWIREHQVAPTLLTEAQAIGKGHRLQFVADAGARIPTSHIRGSEIRIRHPLGLDIASPVVQKVAQNAALRALRAEATHLLAQRLKDLAERHGYEYRSLHIKRLKSRWGSCDQDGNIVLNLFLIQLPWTLIDYVILHELAHTRVLRHGAPFWAEMEQHLPAARQLRGQMREYQPALTSREAMSGMA